MEQEYLTTDELAAHIKMSVKFIEKYRHTGRIPGAVKISSSWRFNKAEVNKRLVSGGQFLLPAPERRKPIGSGRR